MNRRQVALSYHENWGDTTSQDGKGRRVYVTNFPPNATPKDFYKFFGSVDVIEGYSRKAKIAFVQFRRPSHFTFALSRNGESFMGRSIIIEPYKDPIIRKPKRNNSPPIKSVQEYKPRVRVRSRTRSRTRSRSRSLSSNDSQSRRAKNSREPFGPNRRPSGSNKTQQNSVEATAPVGPVDFWGRPLETPPSVTTLTTTTTTIQQMHQVSEVEGDLPREISLTLELLLMQKTAKTLSLVQLQNVINYFESVKIAVQKGNDAIYNGHGNGAAPTTQQQIQDTRDIQQQQQQQSGRQESQGPSSLFKPSEFYAQMEPTGNQESQQSEEEPKEQLDEESQKPIQNAIELLKNIFS